MTHSASTNDLVNYRIKVSGQSSKATEVDKEFPVFSITIDKTLNKIPYAMILLHDGDPAEQSFAISNSKLFEIGKTIEISLGYESSLKSVFKGIITRHALKASGSTPPYLEIYCKDAAYRTALTPQTLSFKEVTDSDALKQVLKKYSGDVSESIGRTAIKHEFLSQYDTTDWDFINLRAEANGQVVMVADGTITTQVPNSSQSPSYTFTYGVDIFSLDLEMDASTQWQQVGGKIWAPDSQASKQVNAGSVSEKSFGATDASKLAKVNQPASMNFLHGGNMTEEEIKAFSTNLLTLNRLSKIRGKLSVQGIADIEPGKTIKISKGADNFEGTAYVSSVHHKLAAGQWLTELSVGLPSQRYIRQYTDVAGLPAAGMLCPIYGLQIGIVKKLTGDPQSAHRIFVYVPMLHQPSEGVWCRIASFYASNKVGAFIMPEKEDEVVIGFINDDVRSPVIVGSLYSSKHATPVTQDENNSIKTLLTKNKLELTFNDKDKVILLKTPGGRTITISDKNESIEITNNTANKIVLDKQNVMIDCNKDITLNAKGNINLQATNGIQLKANNEVKIDGMNISANAKMKAALVGTASAQVQSNATTIIKGAIVQIN